MYTISDSALDRLREGQKVTFDFVLLGSDVGSSEFEFYGVLTSVRPETSMLRCANGHEYAPSAGYKFCPQCGKPLR